MHNALDGWGQAAGVTGEHQGIAVITGAIIFQCAACIGDGVVVIVCVDDPVVVTCVIGTYFFPGSQSGVSGYPEWKLL